MQTKVFDMAGKQVGEITLSDAVFGIEPNEAVVHDVVKNHLANCRQGTQSALTRAEVSGGGIKPWNKKVKRLAMKSVLSDKAASENIVVIDEIKMDSIKTKTFKTFLNAVGVTGKALVVTAENDAIVVKSAANIPGILVTFANLINVYDILNAQKLVVDKAALAKIEEVFA